MKRFTILTIVLLSVTSLIHLSAGSAQFSSSMFEHSSEARKEVGNFPLLSKGLEGNLFLANNRLYKPTDHYGRSLLKHWVIGDIIRVLKTHKHRHYVLANISTGEMFEVKKAILVKKVSGDFPILARVADKKLLLANNVSYKPAGSEDREIARTWQLSDPVRVLKIKGTYRRVLFNLNNHTLIEAYVSDIDSSLSR